MPQHCKDPSDHLNFTSSELEASAMELRVTCPPCVMHVMPIVMSHYPFILLAHKIYLSLSNTNRIDPNFFPIILRMLMSMLCNHCLIQKLFYQSICLDYIFGQNAISGFFPTYSRTMQDLMQMAYVRHDRTACQLLNTSRIMYFGELSSKIWTVQRSHGVQSTG